MDILKLKSKLEEASSEEKSAQMGAYMRDLFKYYGVQKTELREISKVFVRENKNVLDWDIVFKLWNEDERELHYVAMDYLKLRQKLMIEEDFENLYNLITTKSWWDTVDELSNNVGHLVLNTNHGKDIILKWSTDENFWVRRTAIICHRKSKDEMDTELFEKIILNNLGSDEFFINKAIGWALRDYSKVNREWVANFIEKHKNKLSTLSIKEGSKYI